MAKLLETRLPIAGREITPDVFNRLVRVLELNLQKFDPNATLQINTEEKLIWDRFYDRFQFKPSASGDYPGILEPFPSLTYSIDDIYSKKICVHNYKLILISS